MSTHQIIGSELMFDGELRPYVWKHVELVKRNKSGLYQVRALDGKLLNVPQRNLAPVPQLTITRLVELVRIDIARQGSSWDANGSPVEA